MAHFNATGERVGKIHNDPSSGTPSRRMRKEGTKSLIAKGKRKSKR
jgi:hypothetical protein